jgi:CRISPR system Cascade subunit CasE
MYLIRLTLDTRSAQARRDLGNPYDMHRSLVRAFVVDDAKTSPRFLWRLEPQVGWNTPPVVLVQSSHVADWTHFQVLPNYLRKSPETKKFFLQEWLLPEQQYRFRLFANPTVTRAGKRYGLISENAQLAWLAKQGQRQGFNIKSAVVTACDMLKIRKGETSISVQRTCYEGILTAADIALLETAIKVGIGPGKAFGCGLLSLARFGS